MKYALALCSLVSLIALPVLAEEAAPSEGSRWENSIVSLEVTRKSYEYLQPWSKRLKSSQRTGVIIGANEILTTAEELQDRTLIRVQKGGRGKWWAGELRWIDYHADLALVAVGDQAFWRGVEPLPLAQPTASEAEFQILRWRQGRMEIRRAEFNQFTASEGRLSYAPHLQLEVSSEIQGAGSGEPLVAKGQLQGILASQEGTTCTAIPSSFIASILDARRQGKYHGLGYFDFVWQPAENPTTLAYLKEDGEPRGVLVINVPFTPGVEPVVRARDIILKVDGFDIGVGGDYLDPDYGHLILENLATRKKWAGEEVKLEVLRDGKVMDLSYKLPRAEYKSELVPDEVFDQDPEYLIVGGLVFQPLTGALLHSWGSDWKRRSPFRLFYYTSEHPTRERTGLVILTQVLPDVYNLGYQDLKLLVLDEVNGKKINYLPDLREAMQHPVNGFHTFQFVQSDSLRKLVLAADDQDPATKRVLARYGITKDYFFAEPAPTANPGVAAAQ